jgi:tripartite-type tricarboxylate transporter receptor subunit TctC
MMRALRVGMLAALIATSPAAAQVQDYPTRAITIVVPFAPGGLTDVPVRVLAAMMQERIGQNIVIENKPGGSGVVGGTYAARAAPDGYTLFANSIADAQNLHYIPVPYNAVDDFAMIGMIIEGPPLVLIIDAKLPYKSLAELLADAKANPKKISFGTSGPATSPAIALTQLNSLGKTEIVGVPYRGSGEAARNVAAGSIEGAFAFYSQGQAARRRWQTARAGGGESATDCDLGRCADHGGAGISEFRLPRLCRSGGARQDAASDHRVPEQRAQRGRAVAAVPRAHGGARHDRAGRQHAGKTR